MFGSASTSFSPNITMSFIVIITSFSLSASAFKAGLQEMISSITITTFKFSKYVLVLIKNSSLSIVSMTITGSAAKKTGFLKYKTSILLTLGCPLQLIVVQLQLSSEPASHQFPFAQGTRQAYRRSKIEKHVTFKAENLLARPVESFVNIGCTNLGGSVVEHFLAAPTTTKTYIILVVQYFSYALEKDTEKANFWSILRVNANVRLLTGRAKSGHQTTGEHFTFADNFVVIEPCVGRGLLDRRAPVTQTSAIIGDLGAAPQPFVQSADTLEQLGGWLSVANMIGDANITFRIGLQMKI
uniref:Uncharacterized protein n=1 Tax=Romanomermis culicivorax TaxID=13658 RepID=A0A915JUV8_ROMCU